MKRLWRQHRYILMLIAFLPLLLSTIWMEGPKNDADDASVPAVAPLLASDSHGHYLFAAISAGGFLLATLCLFNRVRARTLSLISVGLFTGTIGIFLLYTVQAMSTEAAQETWSGDSNMVLINYTLRAIAYSYRASDNNSGNIEMQIIAYVFGVGLCEELTKILPIVFLLRRSPQLAIADATALGFISGVGFGIQEAILYSQRDYNGSAPMGIYVVRFVSLVAMHGMTTAAAAGIVVRKKLPLTASWRYLGSLIWAIFPAMLLHGLYDTFCSRSNMAWATVVALLQFGLLSYQIESNHVNESLLQQDGIEPAQSMLPGGRR